MKNKIIIPTVVAVFAISGVSTVGSGLQAYALTPEEEQITYVATIEGQLKILEKSIAQAKDLDTAYKYVTDYESASDVQESLVSLTAANRLIVQNSIKLLKQKINNLKANNMAQVAKKSNDDLRQEVRNEIAALKNDIQNTNNRIAQEKAGVLRYIDQEKAGVLRYVDQEKAGVLRYIAQEKAGVLRYIDQEKAGVLRYVDQEKAGIIKHIAQEKDGIIKYVKVQKAEVEAQIKEAKTQFTAKINDLENKIAKLEAKNDSQDDEIKTLKAELASLQNSVSELDSKLESLKTELGDKINGLESELGNLKADFEDLDAEVENIWESISEIWAEIDELLKKIKTESLQAEKRANEYTNSKIAELASRIENNLNERFGKVDKQIAKLNFKGLTAPNTGVERQNSNALLALSSVILTLISSVVVIRKKF